VQYHVKDASCAIRHPIFMHVFDGFVLPGVSEFHFLCFFGVGVGMETSWLSDIVGHLLECLPTHRLRLVGP